MYGDNVEDKTNVHKLASLIGKSPPHFFFTQSCNQSTCRGLRKLREWVINDVAIECIKNKYNLTLQEARYILQKTAAVFVQCVWDVIANLWMRYIIYSKEEPLHKIEWAWWRKEFQDEAGNVSHIHAISRTCVDINNTDGKQALFDKIRGSLQDLVHHQELEDLKQKNIIESSDFLVDIYKNALSYLTHKCHSRCQIPKMSNDGKVEFICKVPGNYLLTTQPQIHSIQPINLPRSPMALAILRRLGLAAEKVLTNNRKEIQITHPQLLMERHLPKCTRNQGKFSPVNTELFVKMPSCQNLQFCTGHTIHVSY